MSSCPSLPSVSGKLGALGWAGIGQEQSQQPPARQAEKTQPRPTAPGGPLEVPPSPRRSEPRLGHLPCLSLHVSLSTQPLIPP